MVDGHDRARPLIGSATFGPESPGSLPANGVPWVQGPALQMLSKPALCKRNLSMGLGYKRFKRSQEPSKTRLHETAAYHDTQLAEQRYV